MFLAGVVLTSLGSGAFCEEYCVKIKQTEETSPVADQKSEKEEEGNHPITTITKDETPNDSEQREISSGELPLHHSTSVSHNNQEFSGPPIIQQRTVFEGVQGAAIPTNPQATPALPATPTTPPIPATPVIPVKATGQPPPHANSLLTKKGLGEDVKKILERGVLRVGMCSIDQPPFHIKRDGQLDGFDVDLAHKLAEVLGVKMQIVEGADWDSLIDVMIDGGIDVIISNLSLTPERAARISHSKPYAQIRQCLLLNRVLLARAGSEGLVTLRQIFEKYSNNTLLIQEGTACIDWAASLFPQAKILTTGSWDEIMSKTQNKEVLGTISDEIEIKKRMKGGKTMEFMPVVIKGKYDFIVVGMQLAATTLKQVVNALIDCNDVRCEVEDTKHDKT